MDSKLKHPYGIFPADIWEMIVLELSVDDGFQLALTNTAMWEYIRHISLEKILNIHPNNGSAIPSFFNANAQHVKILAQGNVNYKSLSTMLSSFYYLESVDLSAVQITEQAPKRLLLSLPRRSHLKNLIVFVSKETRGSFAEAASKNGVRRVHFQSVLKRRKKEMDNKDDEEDKGETLRRCIRTPSPLRDDIRELEEKIDDMKKTFGLIAENSVSVVPAPLKSICQGREYVDVDTVWTGAEETTTKEEAGVFVDRFCRSLLESIIVSSRGSWLYVTQAEAYMRGAKHIDDCANTTITVENPTKTKLLVEQKREFQNQWLEAKVYLKNFEFLITGCLCGNYGNDNVDAFLGASLGNHLAFNDYWRVYVPLAPTPALRQCRLLRNFTKAASGFQWLLKSQRFHENGYSTACALNLHELDGMCSIVAIGSLLLSWKALGQKDKQQLRSMLSNVEELSGFDVNATSQCVDRVRKFEIAKGKKLALEIALLVLNDDNVKDVEYVELYKSLISSRLVTLNKKAIKQKKYLLY